MAIQVRCPNETCGKLLSVRDDYAGKAGKCPNCGAVLTIPEQAAEEAHVTAAPSSPPAGRKRGDEDDYQDPRPRRRRIKYDDEPSLRKKRRAGSPLATIVCLAVATALFVLLALVPLFSMFSISWPRAVPQQPTVAGMIKLTEGKIFMIGGIVAAVLCLASLIVYLTIPENVSDTIIMVGGCMAAAWALTLLLWDLGFIWDIFNASRWWEQNAPPFKQLTLVPGIGLWIGLGAAIAVIILLGILMGLRGKGIWLYPAEGLGLIAGILLLTLNVQPGNAGPQDEDRRDLSATQFEAKIKYLMRYRPLIEGTGEFF